MVVDALAVPEIVYHFTSMQSLLGIIESRCIFATSIAYLNDVKERALFLDLCRKRLPVLQAEGRIGVDVDLAPGSSSHDPLFGLLREPFVASFCQDDDSLLHWRAYCQPQNGVAIGFRTSCLSDARVEQPPQAGMLVQEPWLQRLVYIGEEETEKIDEIILRLYESCKQHIEVLERPEVSRSSALQRWFHGAAESAASFVKHKAFEHERELRLSIDNIRSREDAVRFRVQPSCLIPYVPLRIPSFTQIGEPYISRTEANTIWDAISRVVIGPTPNADLSVLATRALFRSKGMNVDVVKSQVPYRDW